MHIEWVNHASFVAAQGGTRILTDPWIEGRAFNESWSLHSPTRFTYDDFGAITHVWFSHEHPDHFAPPTLKRIPPGIRAGVEILYQQTRDKKLVRFCQGLRFKEIREIPPGKELRLNEDVCLLLGKVRNETDSWILLEMGGRRLLNMNDCVPDTEGLEAIRQAVGKIDVLFTQFSYANWVGNPGDGLAQQRAAEGKLSEMRRQIAVFRPDFVVPCASFVWFSNTENFFMNDGANRIEAAEKSIESTGATPIVMYPGDVWPVGGPWENRSAMARYEQDRISRIRPENLFSHPIVPVEKLLQSAQKYRARTLRVNDAQKLRSFPSFTAFVSDLGTPLTFSFREGGLVSASREEVSDVSLSGASLQYCFDYPWGFDTLEVSGAFRKPPRGDFERLRNYQWISNLNNRGFRMPGLLARILRRLGVPGLDVIPAPKRASLA